jgi:1-acyl-sn-glycerol-3-phosphate acyltransferase
VITLATALAMRLHLRWMGKRGMFRWPFERLLLWMGGIPVDRGAASGLVQTTVDAFARESAFLLVVSPEGTRSKTREWKTGFYRIAQGANVPILLCYVDFVRKTVGFGPLVTATGDMDADIQRIRAFYDDKVGRHEDRFDRAA